MSETMTVFGTLTLVCASGVILGAVFFGGLWWTIRRAVLSKHPALWFLCSLLVRIGITLSGFYLVSGGRWERMAGCLAGFVIGRLVVTWLTRADTRSGSGPPGANRAGANRARRAPEASHAP